MTLLAMLLVATCAVKWWADRFATLMVLTLINFTKGPPMNQFDASSKADVFIKLMLQHQPNIFGSAPLNGVDQAKQVAQSLAEFRK